MAEDVIRPRLGRGLAALIGDVGEDERLSERPRSGQRRAPVEFLKANPRNPRKAFTEAELDDLVNSVREKGVVQPIIVRPAPGHQGSFEIIAGERRWRAAQRAGLHEVPIVVLEVSDREALELAIIENVQRADLNAIEEAAGYEALIASHGYSQNDLSKIIGKSRSHIANTMRLLKLPEDVREKVRTGSLTAGHARALLGVDDPSSAARRIVDEGLTVRDAEAMAQAGASAARTPRSPVAKDADTAALEKQLSDLLGMNVSIDHKGERGQLQVRYANLDQLDELCRRLKG
jgi:ParB family transcriptional regulator, chromosome partitioning protein